jgi:hypothetical protein
MLSGIVIDRQNAVLPGVSIMPFINPRERKRRSQ